MLLSNRFFRNVYGEGCVKPAAHSAADRQETHRGRTVTVVPGAEIAGMRQELEKAVQRLKLLDYKVSRMPTAIPQLRQDPLVQTAAVAKIIKAQASGQRTVDVVVRDLKHVTDHKGLSPRDKLQALNYLLGIGQGYLGKCINQASHQNLTAAVDHIQTKILELQSDAAARSEPGFVQKPEQYPVAKPRVRKVQPAKASQPVRVAQLSPHRQDSQSGTEWTTPPSSPEPVRTQRPPPRTFDTQAAVARPAPSQIPDSWVNDSYEKVIAGFKDAYIAEGRVTSSENKRNTDRIFVAAQRHAFNCLNDVTIPLALRQRLAVKIQAECLTPLMGERYVREDRVGSLIEWVEDLNKFSAAKENDDLTLSEVVLQQPTHVEPGTRQPSLDDTPLRSLTGRDVQAGYTSIYDVPDATAKASYLKDSVHNVSVLYCDALAQTSETADMHFHRFTDTMRRMLTDEYIDLETRQSQKDSWYQTLLLAIQNPNNKCHVGALLFALEEVSECGKTIENSRRREQGELNPKDARNHLDTSMLKGLTSPQLANEYVQHITRHALAMPFKERAEFLQVECDHFSARLLDYTTPQSAECLKIIQQRLEAEWHKALINSQAAESQIQAEVPASSVSHSTHPDPVMSLVTPGARDLGAAIPIQLQPQQPPQVQPLSVAEVNYFKSSLFSEIVSSDRFGDVIDVVSQLRIKGALS